MQISLILAHPDTKSFNHAIAQSAIAELTNNGHQVCYHDLYREKFDPILPGEEIPKDAELPHDLDAHCHEIATADGIVIIHPNWWGQPPAIMKGWIDRIIRPRVAYQFLEGDGGEGVPVGLLKMNCAVIFNTSNTNPEREKEVFGDPLETLWKNCVFGLCGVKNVHRETFSIVVSSTLEQRYEWLQKVRETMKKLFPVDKNRQKSHPSTPKQVLKQ